MLLEKKLTFTAKTFVEDTEIVTYGASLDTSDGDVSFWSRQLDKLACKNNRDIVRADQAEFEDFVYSVADKIKEMNAG